MNAQGVWQVSGMLLWFLWLPIITYNLHQQITMLHIIIRQPRPGHKLELQLQTSIREMAAGVGVGGGGRQRARGDKDSQGVVQTRPGDVILNAAVGLLLEDTGMIGVRRYSRLPEKFGCTSDGHLFFPPYLFTGY